MQNLLNALDVPTPPPLDPGPLWSRLLLETPWYVAALLLVVAVVVYVLMNRRGHFSKGLTTAGVLVALAAAVVGASALIETPRERMRATARQLIDAVVRADGTDLSALLARNARLVYFMSPQGLGKDEIVALVDQQFRGEYRINEWSILESQATMDGPEVGRVQLKVRVVAAEWNVPNVSWWRIDLRREGETGILVTGISPIVIAGVREAQ
ncbi:MAG: hypothetical protein PSX37_09025 [bacterium]|nr:hypothetical protein [bacterium]